MATGIPERFQLFNSQQTKQISIVVKIAGVPDVLSNRPIFTRIRYGDPGLVYGGGAVYGGLRPYVTETGATFRDYLERDASSLTISQKLEPEQGRASISQLTLAFVDRDNYMTELVTPGKIIPEILGAEVEVWMGYEEISYPDEYFRVFRGFVSEVGAVGPIVTLQLSDPNLKRRQQLFYTAKTKTTDRVEYNSRKIQDLVYEAKPGFGTGVSINYTAGGTAGSEGVSVAGDDITVQIQSGVSTADQIRTAVENNVSARALVFVDVASDGSGSNPQVTTGGALNLLISTTIPVASSADFHSPVLGPDGGVGLGVKCYIQIDDEWIWCQPSFLPGVNAFAGPLDPPTLLPLPLQRGQRGTLPAPHDSGSDVTAGVELEGEALELALQIMLSGWGGDFVSNLPLLSIGPHPDPDAWVNYTDHIVLPSKVDAVSDYGLTIGDYFMLVDSVVESGANNNSYFQIGDFEDLDGQPNRVIIINPAFGSLYKEGPTPAKVSFRSQYDVLPKTCGLKMTPKDVDVEQHQFLMSTFLSIVSQTYRFFITKEEASGKSFLEQEVYLPVGAYSLTRRGKVSAGITKPPIADQSLAFLDKDNILDAPQIRPTRGTSSRTFFNEIQYAIDQDETDGDYKTISKFLDSDSLSLIGISSVLKIESRGSRTELGAQTILDKIARFLLSRYKRGAVQISLKVNWEVGVLIEAGDVVALRDEGDLQIANYQTGERDLRVMLFEVIERALDMKLGVVSLKLISGIAGEADDRYGTISPSSKVAAGSTTSKIVIEDSYGILYPGNEQKKWEEYVGQKILVHADDWSYEGETTLQGFDPSNDYAMIVSPALGFTPAAGDVVDIIHYPDTTDPTEAQLYKTIHAFLTPTVAVVTGSDEQTFTVDPADIGKFRVGAIVLVHSEDYGTVSAETKVESVNVGTNTVVVEDELGFTPAAGHLVELIGYKDGGGAYRWI